MLTAPFVAPAPSDPAASRLATETSEAADYASSRLKHTVWDRRGPVAVYRALLHVGGLLSRLGVSANALTATSVVFAVVSGVAIGLGHFVAGAVLILLSGACDALDGAVARASGTTSRYGALLDSTVDRLADALPLLGVVFFYAGSPVVVVPTLAMMGVFLVSYVRARAEGLGGDLPPLFMRRTERVVVLVLILAVASIDLSAVSALVQGARITVEAPLLLLGVSLLGAMSFFGAASALRSARSALAGPRGGSISAPSE